MTPQVGQHVKCILRNGAIAEGTVEEWFTNTVQLRSLDGESILIITHPAEDIMLIKIILDQPKSQTEEIADRIRAKSILNKKEEELEQKFREAADATDPHDIDGVKSLAELRIDLNKQERRIIAEKLKDHMPSTKPGTTPYHYPSVVTKEKSAYQPGRIPNGPSRSPKKSST